MGLLILYTSLLNKLAQSTTVCRQGTVTQASWAPQETQQVSLRLLALDSGLERKGSLSSLSPLPASVTPHLWTSLSVLGLL